MVDLVNPAPTTRSGGGAEIFEFSQEGYVTVRLGLPAELYPQIREIVMFNFYVPCTGVVYRFNRAPS